MTRKLRSEIAFVIVLTLVLSFVPVAFAAPTNITYKEYLKMSTEEQLAYRDQFDSSAAFKKWYLEAKQAYEDSQNKVVIGDGNTVDIGQILNPAIASGTCGNDLTWTLSQSGVLTITGSGAMYDYASVAASWSEHADSIYKVELPQDITKIGKNAFASCSSITDVYYAGTEFNWSSVNVYGGNTYLTNATFHYREAILAGISVKTLPSKTIYTIGDSLDQTGLVITLSFNDGSTEDVTSGFTLSELDSSTTGVKVITVKYANQTTTFEVTVNASPVRIEILSQPAKVTYWVGESLDIAGLTLNLVYNDNSVTPITTGFEVNGFESATTGDQIITVTYLNFTTEFLVTVNEITLTNVEILSAPAQTTYWVGDSLNAAGLVLNLTFSDGSNELVDSGYDISGFDSTTPGQNTVTVTYQGFTVSFVVTINEVTLTGIEIITLPTKTQYWIGESFDPTGLVLRLTYTNGKTSDITEGFELNGFNSLVEGVVVINLSYQGFSDDFDVKIIKGGQCGDDIFWTVENYVLTLTGFGAMYDYAYATAPWFNEEFYSIAIDPAITYIGSYAFADTDCLTTVVISDTVMIGNAAYAHCDNLKSFSVSDDHPLYNVDSQGALYSKSNTILIQVPGAFNGGFTIPVSVTEIAEGAFFGCRKINSILFSGSTGATGGYVERDEANSDTVNATNTVHFGNSNISVIGAYAFADCERITAITIPQAVTTINEGTFLNCYNLAKVFHYNNITEINESAFAECNFLNSVVYDGTKTQWQMITIGNGNDPLHSTNVLWLDEIKFSSAAPGLYNDIAMYYTIDKTVFDAMGAVNPYLVVTFNGVKTTLTDYTVTDNGTKYTIGFFNIAPNQMGDTITATLYATYGDEVYEGATLNYSVALYCTRMLSNATVVNNAAYAELRTLLVDLLNYGAAAQIYTGYKTDSLVNASLTATQASWGTSNTPALSSKTAITNRIDSPAAGWKTATLILDDSVTIRLIFTAADISGMSMKITTDANPTGWLITEESFIYDEANNYYYVDFGELHAGQMRECIYATVYNGETAVSHTLRYSIESYAASFAANTTYPTVAELVKAMMRYGDAAYNFAN